VSQRPALGCLFEVVETLVLTVVIFLGIQTFVAQPYKVQQGSMENTLQPDQYVLVDKLTPRWAPYQRGDIVVFDPPENWSSGGGVPFIKRVIGLPGDRVELREGRVYVNDVELEEPYIFEDDGVAQTTEPSPGGPSEWLVPSGDLLVMGDHRDNSADSRSFGPIEATHVIGRAWLRYWPFDTFGILPTPSHPELNDGSSPSLSPGASPGGSPALSPKPEPSPSP
jgi:signal peptidase I